MIWNRVNLKDYCLFGEGANQSITLGQKSLRMLRQLGISAMAQAVVSWSL